MAKSKLAYKENAVFYENRSKILICAKNSDIIAMYATKNRSLIKDETVKNFAKEL